MKIAVFCPDDLPHSSRIYMENVAGEISRKGHEVVYFSGRELPDQVDIYWQPSAGRNGPSSFFINAHSPVVVTFHGAANLALPLRQCFMPGLKNQLGGFESRISTYFGWRFKKPFWKAVITVSNYAKSEAIRYLKIPEKIITPIYHGVNFSLFYPKSTGERNAPYFLHISSYQPKKNLHRIIAAYKRLDRKTRPRLVIVAPGYQTFVDYEGIELLRNPMNHDQIAALYRNALGFVFPSLHETFGMPIIESMACGCPVITSTHPGCSEVAGDAALLVDPYSIDEIYNAMLLLLEDRDVRQDLKKRGIDRARMFTWEKSAQKHLMVFHEAAELLA